MLRMLPLLCVLLGGVLPLLALGGLKQDLDALTGGSHTRIVWLEGGKRLDGGGRLLGYDSKTDQTHQILPAASQTRPLLCSKGNRVVITIGWKVHVVDWDGKNKQYLADGFASDVWVEPGTAKEWVFIRTGQKSTGGKLYRHSLDDPSQKVLLWDKTKVGINYMSWWQVSADGKWAADFLPWDQGYVIENGGLTANGAHSSTVDGCWSSMAPDNSYVWFALRWDNGHERITTFRGKSKLADRVPLNAYPNRKEHYHPKFASNGARYLVVTGGYTGNADSKDADVFAGRFSADYKKIERWVRVTQNTISDYFPEMWVGVVASTQPPKPSDPKPSIQLEPSELKLEMEDGAAAPAPVHIAVSSAAALTGVKAVSNQAWLKVEISTSGNGHSIRNIVSSAGLKVGTHTATVTVSATNADPASRNYSVVLTIKPKGVVPGGDPKNPIVVLSPKAGDKLSSGQKVVIKWSAINDVSGVTLNVSVDGGKTWPCITCTGSVSREDAGWGQYAWTVPATMAAAGAKIRIADYFDGAVYGVSGEFSIGKGASLSEKGVVGKRFGAIEVQVHGSRLLVNGLPLPANPFLVNASGQIMKGALNLLAPGSYEAVGLPKGWYALKWEDASKTPANSSQTKFIRVH